MFKNLKHETRAGRITILLNWYYEMHETYSLSINRFTYRKNLKYAIHFIGYN